MTLIALSAAYGAGGSVIGPAVAERLGVPFVDRGIPVAVAESLDVPLADALADEDLETAPSLLERLLAGFQGADTGALSPLPAEMTTSQDFHRATLEVLRRQAAEGRGVILGRGAVAALREDPRALRVRLTGPAAARERQAVQLGHVSPKQAATARRRLDQAHREYLRRFHDVDIDDPTLYHLVIDATALSAEACVELIVAASAPNRHPQIPDPG